MSKIYFEIEDDAVVKYTPMPEAGENTYKVEVVMNKEIFQECYKKWIEPQKIHCNCTDEEIAKSFIEDVEAVKDLLLK